MQMFWWSFVVGCSLVVNFAATLPTTTTESANATAPREFPKLNQNYTFVDNSSIRENLASHSDIDTEVEDLLETNEEKEETVVNPSEQDEDIGKKEVVEWIENGEDTEDSKFSTTTTSTTRETDQTTQKPIVFLNTTLEPYRDGIPIIDGTVAAILVGVFLVICIFGYTGLILWRRSLEMKYGSREMLVDKDEMYDPDDMRHFSI